MDRLTQTSDKGGVAFTFDLDITCKPSEAQKILKLAEKLKRYEDLGTVEELDELTRKALVDRVENVIADFDERELEDTDLDSLNREELTCISESLQYGQVAELRERQVNGLIQYIFNNLHWCPFKDESNIDFEKECVGFREKGCKECILRNIEQLN